LATPFYGVKNKYKQKQINQASFIEAITNWVKWKSRGQGKKGQQQYKEWRQSQCYDSH